MNHSRIKNSSKPKRSISVMLCNRQLSKEPTLSGIFRQFVPICLVESSKNNQSHRHKIVSLNQQKGIHKKILAKKGISQQGVQ